MNICSIGHNKIMYEGNHCPCCRMSKLIKLYLEEINELKDIINHYKKYIF